MLYKAWLIFLVCATSEPASACHQEVLTRPFEHPNPRYAQFECRRAGALAWQHYRLPWRCLLAPDMPDMIEFSRVGKGRPV